MKYIFWIICFVLGFAVTVTATANHDKKPNINLLIQLYETRLNAAKLDLQADEILCEYRREALGCLEGLGVRGAVPTRTVKDAHLVYDLVVIEVAQSKNAVREAEIQLEIIKLGRVDLADFKPDIQPRIRKSR